MTAWKALRGGFDAFTRQLPLLLGAYLVILVFQVAIGLLIPDSLALLESAVLMIVLSPLYAGQFLLALKVVRDEPARFNDLFAGFPRVGSIILARLAVAVMIILGSIALIFPGIVFALMYTFVPVLYVDPEQGERCSTVRAAMSRSAEISEGFRGTLFLVSLLLGIPILVWSLVSYFSIVAGISPWIADLIAIFGGFLFIGPVAATSTMVIYDHALKRLLIIEGTSSIALDADASDNASIQQAVDKQAPTS